MTDDERMVEDMSDAQVVGLIRKHLQRTFIGPLSEEQHRIENADGSVLEYPKRDADRFVVVFDRLVAAAGPLEG